MRQRKKILITSGQWQSALCCMQSLGRQGHDVYLIDEEELSILASSKYCRGHFRCPCEEDAENYYAFVLNLVKTKEYQLLIPISDQCVKIFSRHKKELSQYVSLLIPDEDVVSLANDKVESCRFALKNNISIPKTYFPQTLDELQILSTKLRYPCVIKKSESIAGRGVFHIHRAEELLKFYHQFIDQRPWPVIQEFIEGKCFSFVGVVDRGVLKSYFMYEIPYVFTKGGTPTLAYSFFDEKLLTQAKDLCRLLHWTGAINLDYISPIELCTTNDNKSKETKRKIDFLNTIGKEKVNKSGEYLLLEINPRFGGTLNFSYRMGLDLPSDYLKIVLGQAEDIQQKNYKQGILFRTVLPNEVLWASNHKDYLKTFIGNLFRFSSKTNLYWDDPKLFWMQMKETRWLWQTMRAKERIGSPNGY